MRKIILNILTGFLIVILLLTTTEISIGITSSTISTTPKIQEYGVDKDGVVTFDDKYFAYLHYQVEENPLKYNGRDVVITGFIYKDPDFKENEFKIARMTSSFCADPAYVLGLMTQVEDASNFEHRQWVTVKGTLTITKDRKIYLEPKSIEKIEMRPDYYLY